MNDTIVMSILMSGILFGTPLLIAGTGELLGQKAGILNLGVDGMMLVGAVTAFGVSNALQATAAVSIVAAFVIAGVAGSLMALIHAFVCVTLKANQIVSGLTLSILGGAVGLSTLIGETGGLGRQPGVHRLEALNLFGLKDLPIVGPLIFNQTAIVYVSWLLVGAAAFYLKRTRAGLNLRAVGESPSSADVMGVSVARYQYIHTLIGGAMAGLGGAVYTLMLSPGWSNGMTAGAGWIAVALVIFSRWSPKVLPHGAYLFGAVTGLGYVLQAEGVGVPTELFAAAPYILTMVALVAISSFSASRQSDGPAALGVPYIREDA